MMFRRWVRRRLHGSGERGSMSVELVLIAPALALVILLLVAGARVALAGNAVESAAVAAARDASLSRTTAGAQAGAQLAAQVAGFVEKLRSAPFRNAFHRPPGIAESVEWARALVSLDTLALDPEVVADTAGILFKQREDVAALTHELASELLKPEAA